MKFTLYYTYVSKNRYHELLFRYTFYRTYKIISFIKSYISIIENTTSIFTS